MTTTFRSEPPVTTQPTDERMRQIFNTLEPYIENTYGIPVRIRDVPSPFTGDLDGAEIHVDYAEEIESALFIIAHLFGHTVQWNTSEAAREIGYRLYPNPTDEQLRKLQAYELEACQYSMELFHRAGVTDVDQWLSDYSTCDFAYLMHFYKTNEKRPFKSFWRAGSPLLLPKAIPEFHPQKWVSRWQGIVV
jgi:hypothetical protein